MILILSNKGDVTTDHIIDWLAYYDTEYLRWEDEMPIVNCNISKLKSEVVLKKNTKDSTIKLEKINGFLYRKGDIKFVGTEYIEENEPIYNQINQYQTNEGSAIVDWILKKTKRITIGNINAELYLTKTNQLLGAESIGFKIPDYLITKSKSQLIKFVNENKLVVTKPLTKHFSFNDAEIQIGASFSKPISEQFVESLGEQFSVSFFQKYIEKKFEIRTFVIGDELYSMAIFSQKNTQTQYDYRNYSESAPNRLVPFRHTEEDRKKVLATAKFFQMETMSIDFIMSKTGDLFFLEINPTGQFGWLSNACNYYLEKIIAKKLINETKLQD